MLKQISLVVCGCLCVREGKNRLFCNSKHHYQSGAADAAFIPTVMQKAGDVVIM